jgi:signal peptidase I
MEDLNKPNARSKPIRGCYELAEVLVTAVISIAVMFLFVARFAGVVGSSMVPTLSDHDWLAVTAGLVRPQSGQIVIISPRTNGFHQPLVKRVIAVGGDELDLRDGNVYLNGTRLDEPYLPEGTETQPAFWNQGDLTYPVKVPKGALFVMGDNRGGSADSRYSSVGFISENDILGMVLFRFVPFYSKNPSFHFTMKVR